MVDKAAEFDDAGVTVAGLRYLRTAPGAALLQMVCAAANASIEARHIEAWRRSHPRDAVHAAVVLAELQKKATGPKGKFAGAAFVWAVPEALEQASSRHVARHKAQRFAALQQNTGIQAPILDLCCGIGGDALALASVADVFAVDLSEVRAFCAAANAAQANAQASSQTGAADVAPHRLWVVRSDVARLPISRKVLAPMPVHLDPAHRAAGRRRHAYEDLIPGPSVIQPVLQSCRAAALKLSPGVDFASLPTGHVEVISERGVAVQAILWTGDFVPLLGNPEHRTATVLGDHPPFSITGAPASSGPLADPAAIVFEVDAAVHRAGLAGTLAEALNLTPINVDGGYLTGPLPLQHPALTAFEHIVTLPFSEKRVVYALHDLKNSAASGPVEVKTRGGLRLDTDALQRAFTRAAPLALTVLIYRGIGDVRAAIARRPHTAAP